MAVAMSGAMMDMGSDRRESFGLDSLDEKGMSDLASLLNCLTVDPPSLAVVISRVIARAPQVWREISTRPRHG